MAEVVRDGRSDLVPIFNEFKVKVLVEKVEKKYGSRDCQIRAESTRETEH
jgi:hypothetical protein